MKLAAYVGGLLGLVLLLTLFTRADLVAMLRTLGWGGWPLLWLIPYRALFFLLYAAGWRTLLRPSDPQHRAGLGYLFWVTTVRDAIDRLLPVASIGGGVAAVRLLRWRGLATAPVAASVIVEILLTLTVSYLFAALGFVLLTALNAGSSEYHRLVLAFLFTLPVPAVSALLLRYGSVFARLQGLLRPLVGETALSQGAAALDSELQASLRRARALLATGALQFAAFVSGSLEVWFALLLFGHPVSVKAALILESMTQAMRHLAFFVPGALGVQEAALLLFGRLLGIDSELALAVSMAKRARELLCALPSLVSWQWAEARRLQEKSAAATPGGGP